MKLVKYWNPLLWEVANKRNNSGHPPPHPERGTLAQKRDLGPVDYLVDSSILVSSTEQKEKSKICLLCFRGF